MDEYYWTVGDYVNNPETLEQARSRAERECQNTRKKTYLYKLVGVVSPGEPTWDSDQQPATPPAPADPEPLRFKVGDEVEVCDEETKNVWVRGKVTQTDASILPYYVEASGFASWFCPNEVRPRPAQEPQHFKFGQAVRVGKSIDGTSYNGKDGVVVSDKSDSEGDLRVVIRGHGSDYFKPSQLTPL